MASGHHRANVALPVLLAVAFGGMAGAVCRYLVDRALPTATGRFPIGTFVVNVSGSLLVGFLLVTLERRFAQRRLLRPLLGTGVLGGYTTFSTLGVDAVLLGRAHHVLTAGLYVAVSVVCGLGAALFGMAAARVLPRRQSWRGSGT